MPAWLMLPSCSCQSPSPACGLHTRGQRQRPVYHAGVSSACGTLAEREHGICHIWRRHKS